MDLKYITYMISIHFWCYKRDNIFLNIKRSEHKETYASQLNAVVVNIGTVKISMEA